MLQDTLIILKPDAIKRGLVGELLQRFEKCGLFYKALKIINPENEQIKSHYFEHKDKKFFPELMEYFKEGPIIVTILTGNDSINVCRKIVGSTNPKDASPGTIRGDYCHFLVKGQNLIHASANEEDAKREIDIWFSDVEKVKYIRYDYSATISSGDF